MSDLKTHVTSLRIQPIKACGIFETPDASITQRGLAVGLVGDRRLALIDDNNVVITQRRAGHSNVPGERGHPELTLVKISLLYDAGQPRQIVASFDGHGSTIVDPQAASEEIVTVTLHGKTSPAHLVRSDADAWFSGVLGRHVRLINQTDEDIRRSDPNFSADPKNRLSLADGYQILLTSMASLRGLEAATSRPWDMNVFRPNIVVDGDLEDHAENGWRTVRIGQAMLECVKPSIRCEVTTIDLQTGKLPEGPITQSEPWATLNRLWPVRFEVGGTNVDGKRVGQTRVSGPAFGENCEPARLGRIRVGDPLIVERSKIPPKWQRR